MRDRIEVAIAAGFAALAGVLTTLAVFRLIQWLVGDLTVLWIFIVLIPLAIGVLVYLTEKPE